MLNWPMVGLPKGKDTSSADSLFALASYGGFIQLQNQTDIPIKGSSTDKS